MRTPLLSSVALAVLLTGCSSVAPVDTGSASSSSAAATISSASSSRSAATSSVKSVKPATNGDGYDPLSAIDMTAVPAAFSIKVAFTPQAPTGDWTPELNEACEEASLYMVEKYLSGTAMPAPAQVEKDLYAMIDWEEQNGYSWDMNAEEVAEMARKYYDRNARVYTGADVTADNIRALLSAGHPVIIPAAGRTLGNPYFSGDGPPYHMFVLVGYDSKGFISNDVGTRRGDKYRYSESTIMNGIHDWNGSIDTIMSGPKAMLVVGK